ncbi:RNA polymerase-binding protein RbpA [Pseudonocardia sp.]|uniref:RNA polymerase-binding protein RbpA n=1 Tax=Pseudonocardia sp. TaxID=60912 RepID=UPI0026386752|nr:RNA polymerase-binding protein RbpA [Pseudonocardia sp.]
MIRPIWIHAGDEAPLRRVVSYWCVRGHHTPRRWYADATAPELWECRCGLPAGRDRARPPDPATWRPFKSPLDHLLARRSEAECEALLDEALQSLRARRRGRRVRGPRT